MLSGFENVPAGKTGTTPTQILFKLKEASAALGLSVGMLRKLARSGQLKVVRIGRSVRIPQAEIIRIAGGVQ